MTLDVFRAALVDPDPEVRAAYLGKLMRQAKPDDVFEFVRLREIVEFWPRLERMTHVVTPLSESQRDAPRQVGVDQGIDTSPAGRPTNFTPRRSRFVSPA